MKNKLIILVILVVLYTSQSFGQQPSEYTEGVSKLLTWFSDIDVVLTKISDKENLKKIYRQLGYVSEDIDNIALGKLLLAAELSKFSDSDEYTELNKLKPQIDDILTDINKLLERLESIKSAVSQTDQTAVEQIIQTVRSGFMNKKLNYLIDIKAFLYGQNIALNKIKTEAIQSKNIAESASIKIKEAKLKIKAKLY
jgi:hypothetical protein